MALSAQLIGLLRPETETPAPHRLHVELAATADDVRAAQRLRYQVFVEEMGARIDATEPGVESDRYDGFCQHLLVRDLDTQRVVGCYRILTDTQAALAGGYYSQSEFDMTRILALPGRFMEVGRTCVHPDYRNGATIGLLWQGLARYLLMNKFDYLMGCASIPLRHGTHEAASIYERLAKAHLAPESWRVYPRTPLPRLAVTDNASSPVSEVPVAIPPLVKAYVRVGAKLCGEPAWDPHFNCADLFILLRADDINARYARHFLARAA
jgi:putative hemolysin